MRVVLVGPTYPFRGGIAHHTTLLARALRARHDLRFHSFTRQYPGILFPGATDKDPSTASLADSDVLYTVDSMNPLTWRTTARDIVAFDPDLVVIPWWVVFWAPLDLYLLGVMRRRTRAVCALVCHNVTEHEEAGLKVALSRRVLGRAHRLVTSSAEETAKVRQLLGPDAPVVTAFHPTYADIGAVGGEAVSREAARAELGVSGRVLLFFGFVRPYKGLDTLLESMARLPKDVTLVIAGEFWKDRQQYLDTIARLDLDRRVRIFDEYIPNERIPVFFRAADLVVQPYRSVTGSGVLQLAYGLDTPVVATSVGCIPEVIRDGENGVLVPPGDPAALANAIERALEPATLEQLRQGAVTTKDRYSWERFAALVTGEARPEDA